MYQSLRYTVAAPQKRLKMVASNDRSRADVERVNQQLEERHYEFRSNCHDGEGSNAPRRLCGRV